MFKNSFPHIFSLIQRLLISLLIYTLCRALMLAFNYSAFEDVGISLFIYALKFDLSAIFFVHSLFLVLHLLPLKTRDSNIYSIVLKVLFHLSNSIYIAFNCIDIEYFKYTGKRSTYDIFSLANTGDDFTQLIPQFLKDFWYIFIIVLALIFLSEYLYRKTQKTVLDYQVIQNTLNQSILGVFCLGISIVIMRGGMQLKPLRINSAGLYTISKNIPLILNTPFTIIKTISSEYLTEYYFFDAQNLKVRYNAERKYQAFKADTSKPNVVLIIMESFSKEHIGILSGKASSTPFLDSLFQEGLICTNAFANGKKSIEGIPSIISATPSLMNTPYINSPYIGNSTNSLPSLMKQAKYHTSFYHGGKNGTMGFDAYCKTAGFDYYFGKNEYKNQADYDGNWGIFDEPYFNYYADELSKIKQPFFSCIFSLSSHHPYSIPPKHIKRFGNGDKSLPISIQYADFALREFFEKAKKMPWYEHTLFVITADHTGVSDDKYFSNNLGMYQIPVFFYKSDGSLKGKHPELTQQLDIMPSILHYTNYTEPFFCFGQSIFDKQSKGFAINFINDEYQLITNDYIIKSIFDKQNKGFAINFMNDEYQLITNDYIIKSTSENIISFYEYKKDSLLKNDLTAVKKTLADSLHSITKAIIQTYNYSLINNKQAKN